MDGEDTLAYFQLNTTLSSGGRNQISARLRASQTAADAAKEEKCPVDATRHKNTTKLSHDKRIPRHSDCGDYTYGSCTVVQDWASSAAVPLMGGPRVGAASNPRVGAASNP